MKTNDQLIWKTLSSRYLERKPWFTVRVDAMELPNGGRIDDYYVLEYPDWVNVIAVTREGKMVLVEQYRHGAGKVFFELVAGVKEASESHLDAAKRELLEETGYGNGKWELFSVLSANPSTHNNRAYTFLATGVEKLSGQKLDECEALTAHVFDANAVFKMLQDGEILQALMAAPLWKYFYERVNK